MWWIHRAIASDSCYGWKLSCTNKLIPKTGKGFVAGLKKKSVHTIIIKKSLCVGVRKGPDIRGRLAWAFCEKRHSSQPVDTLKPSLHGIDPILDSKFKDFHHGLRSVSGEVVSTPLKLLLLPTGPGRDVKPYRPMSNVRVESLTSVIYVESSVSLGSLHCFQVDNLTFVWHFYCKTPNICRGPNFQFATTSMLQGCSQIFLATGFFFLGPPFSFYCIMLSF